MASRQDERKKRRVRRGELWQISARASRADSKYHVDVKAAVAEICVISLFHGMHRLWGRKYVSATRLLPGTGSPFMVGEFIARHSMFPVLKLELRGMTDPIRSGLAQGRFRGEADMER